MQKRGKITAFFCIFFDAKIGLIIKAVLHEYKFLTEKNEKI